MKTILVLILTIVDLTTTAQNADPYISIRTNPSTITLSTNSTLEIITGNVGNETIVSNSMRVTVTAGSNAQIISMVDTSKRWFQKSLGSGAGNTLILVNTSTKPFGSFDLSMLSVIVKGVAPGGPAPLSGTIEYLPGRNPLLGGREPSGQGNANITNDTSLTSLIVVN